MKEQQRVRSETAQGDAAVRDQEPQVWEQQVETEIQALLATEMDPVLLSNKLFSQGGLFSQLAKSPEERRKVAHSALFKEAQRRVHALRQRAVAETDGQVTE